MLLDLDCAPHPKSIQRILLQEEADDLLGLGLDRPVLVVRPLDVVVDGVAEQLLGRLAKEGDTADEKLVEDDSHAPPVNRLAVALPQDHLRRNVLRRPKHLLVGELLGLLVDVALVEVGGKRHEAHLGEAKVGELDVAEGGDEEVVGLEVPVDDAEGVEVLHGQHGLGKVKPERQTNILILLY